MGRFGGDELLGRDKRVDELLSRVGEDGSGSMTRALTLEENLVSM